MFTGELDGKVCIAVHVHIYVCLYVFRPYFQIYSVNWSPVLNNIGLCKLKVVSVNLSETGKKFWS